MDSSSGSNVSSQSYEADDDAASIFKIRVKLYGTNLFEMAVGGSDTEHKKGSKSGTELLNGRSIVGSINRYILVSSGFQLSFYFTYFLPGNISPPRVLSIHIKSPTPFGLYCTACHVVDFIHVHFPFILCKETSLTPFYHSANRKTAWLIFFGAIFIGAVFCLFSHENVAVDEALDMALQSSKNHLRH